MHMNTDYVRQSSNFRYLIQPKAFLFEMFLRICVGRTHVPENDFFFVGVIILILNFIIDSKQA